MAQVRQLVIAPNGVTVAVGATVQFNALAIKTDGTTSDVTNISDWQSSNPAAVECTQTGLATAVADGTAEISATYYALAKDAPVELPAGGPLQDTAVVVVNVTLQSLAVAPATGETTVGGAHQFSAIGTYSDGSTEDLTSLVQWDTSNAAVATVDANGLATAIGAGAAAILASITPGTRSTAGQLVAGGSLNVTEPDPIPPPVAIGIGPCEALLQAKQQLYLLAAGQAVVAVDTPQLGRVEFNRGSIGDLQRLVDRLAYDCAVSQGQCTAGTRRRPLSIEAWP
jgi:hypothetical protein